MKRKFPPPLESLPVERHVADHLVTVIHSCHVVDVVHHSSRLPLALCPPRHLSHGHGVVFGGQDMDVPLVLPPQGTYLNTQYRETQNMELELKNKTKNTSL